MATAGYVCNCNFDVSKRTIEILPSLGQFEKIPKTQRNLIEAQAQQFCSTLDIKTIRFQLAISIDVDSLREEVHTQKPDPELQKYVAESKDKQNRSAENLQRQRDLDRLDGKKLFHKKNVTFATSTKERDLEDWILENFENKKSRKCRNCPFFHEQRMFIIHFHCKWNCTYALSLAVWNDNSKAQAFIYNLISTKDEESVIFPRSVVVLLTCPLFVKVNLRNYPQNVKPMSFFPISVFSSFLGNFNENAQQRYCYFREMLQVFKKREKMYFCSLDGWKEGNYSRTAEIEAATIVDALNLITFLLLEKVSCSWKELYGSITETTFQKLKELQRHKKPSREPKNRTKDHRSQQDYRSHSNKFRDDSELGGFGISTQGKIKTKSQKETKYTGFASLRTETQENEWVSSDLASWSTNASVETPKKGSSFSRPETFPQEPKLETWPKIEDEGCSWGNETR